MLYQRPLRSLRTQHHRRRLGTRSPSGPYGGRRVARALQELQVARTGHSSSQVWPSLGRNEARLLRLPVELLLRFSDVSVMASILLDFMPSRKYSLIHAFNFSLSSRKYSLIHAFNFSLSSRKYSLIHAFNFSLSSRKYSLIQAFNFLKCLNCTQNTSLFCSNYINFEKLIFEI